MNAKKYEARKSVKIKEIRNSKMQSVLVNWPQQYRQMFKAHTQCLPT